MKKIRSKAFLIIQRMLPLLKTCIAYIGAMIFVGLVLSISPFNSVLAEELTGDFCHDVIIPLIASSKVLGWIRI